MKDSIKAEHLSFDKPIRDWSEITSRRRLWFKHGCLDEYYFSAVILGNFDSNKPMPSREDIRANFCTTFAYWKDAENDEPLAKDLIDAGTEFL